MTNPNRWEKAAISGCFKMLCWYLCGGTEENHENIRQDSQSQD
jgi:hypothetical protein